MATRLCLPHGWQELSGSVRLDGAALSDPYPATYLPDQPASPCIAVNLETHGVKSTTHLRFEVPPLVLPSQTAEITPLAEVVNLAASRREIGLQVSSLRPQHAELGLDMPAGWLSTRTGAGFAVQPPEDVAVGMYHLLLTIDGSLAQTVRVIAQDHVDSRALVRPATTDVLVIDAALPDVRVGYMGGGNDRVDHWLGRMGADVTPLTDADMQSDQRLDAVDTIVIGIFALKSRPALIREMPRIHSWIAAGGTLLTLYHRPWDNWDPEVVPPAMLQIGQPSLRWRVTDETAAVTHLADHPVLTSPNKITAEDWSGWLKERGLYFAKAWANAYTPLVEMADPGEAAHRGALLTAEIGKGRHTHCALILHHQMEKLVPGAFRLMANLIA